MFLCVRVAWCRRSLVIHITGHGLTHLQVTSYVRSETSLQVYFCLLSTFNHITCESKMQPRRVGSGRVGMRQSVRLTSSRWITCWPIKNVILKPIFRTYPLNADRRRLASFVSRSNVCYLKLYSWSTYFTKCDN